jgi:hypothetical protein
MRFKIKRILAYKQDRIGIFEEVVRIKHLLEFNVQKNSFIEKTCCIFLPFIANES